MSVNPKLEALRLQIRVLEGHRLETSGDTRILPFASQALNAPLPRGGLEVGALHEFYTSGVESELAPAVTAFAATIAAQMMRRKDGYLLWAASVADCYPPGLARLGLNPSRIVWAECSKDAEVLSVMEEALHSRALAAVLGEAGALSLKTGRRLAAAARQAGTPALLLRRHRSKPSKAAAHPSGAAATRWRVSAVRSFNRHPGTGLPVSGTVQIAKSTFFKVPDNAFGVSGMTAEEPGLGPPRFRLDLDYCRNGRTASWIVEASDGESCDNAKAGHVRVVAELRDDAYPPERAPARKARRAARSA